MNLTIGNKYTKWLCFGLLVLWMSVIFYMSCENADDSTKTSGVLVDMLAKLFNIELYSDAYFTFTNFIRKCAHLFEFAVLGGIAFLNVSHYRIKPFLRATLSAGFTMLYASTDELHQYFVPGRACRFTDVCIDTFGGLLGIIFTAFIIKLFLKLVKK